jgi:hypothetical protein
LNLRPLGYEPVRAVSRRCRRVADVPPDLDVRVLAVPRRVRCPGGLRDVWVAFLVAHFAADEAPPGVVAGS